MEVGNPHACMVVAFCTHVLNSHPYGGGGM